MQSVWQYVRDSMSCNETFTYVGKAAIFYANMYAYSHYTGDDHFKITQQETENNPHIAAIPLRSWFSGTPPIYILYSFALSLQAEMPSE